MILLILGLALWIAAHLFKRLAAGARSDLQEKMGDGSKGLFAVLIVLSVVLMWLGYRSADFVAIWFPPSFFGHLNNLLMLVAFYIYLSTMAAPNLWIARLRHPQLIGFKTWAIAHLLVNGDLASIVLFGGLLAWAVAEVIVINRAEPEWSRSETAPIKSELVMVGVGVAGFVVVALIHLWLGVNPFGSV